MSSVSRPKKKEKRHNKQNKRKTFSAKHPPAPAKITQPRIIENVYLRKRLFKELDNAVKKPVIWITAPPGAGKTTLISTYLEERRLPCIWYQIDEGDEDIASFFHYMGIAAKHAAPRYKKPLPNLTPEYLAGGLPTFTRNFFRELFNRVSKSQSIKWSKRSGTNRSFIIVLDNYQEAPADSPLHEIIQTGLSETPEGINVIIISRIEPPSAFAGLRANNRMNILGWNELKLSLEEISAIVQLKLHKKLSREIIQELHDITNGWVAGLVLMLEHHDSAEMMQRRGSGFTTQAMFDYFAGEIFQKLDEASQEMLLQTAFLPIMTARFAQSLSGSHQAGELVAELNRRGYFIEKKPLPETVYQYHPLFRKFLMARARQQLTDAQLTQTQRKSAEILEGAGQFEDAVVLYSRAGDWQSMARVMLANARSMIEQGRSNTLEAWLRAIPEEMYKEQPWLQYWLGISCMTTSPPESESLLEGAYHAFRAQGDAAGLFLAWAAVVDVIWLQQTDWTKFDRWLDRLEADRKQHGDFPNTEIAARVFSCLCQIVIWTKPDHPRLYEFMQEAKRLQATINEPSIQIRLGIALYSYYQYRGDELLHAKSIGRLNDQLLRQGSLLPFDELWTYTGRIYTPCYVGQYRESVRLAEDALRLADESGIHVIDALLCGAGLHGALYGNDLAATDVMLARMERAMAGRPPNLDTALYHYLKSWRVRLDGNTAGAAALARLALETVQRIGAGTPEILCRLGFAHALLAEGDLKGAESESAWIRAKADAGRLRWLMNLCDLFDAQCAFTSGNEAAGIKYLREAMAAQEQYDLGFFFPQWLRDDLLDLYVKAMEHGCITAYVLHHIREQQLVPKPGSIVPDAWPFPIKLYTLGRFSLLVDDKPMKFSGKSPHKPLEFLKAVIALGGREVSADSLIETLWPDAEGDVARRAFDTTLHRLRKLIGDKALRLGEGRLTLDASYIWVDAWELGRLLGEMEKRLKETRPQKEMLHRLLDRAVALYHGRFLREDMEPYLLAPRERLHQRLLFLLKELGRHWEEEQSYEDAIFCYEKGLAIDPSVEAFYQRLMLTYQGSGQKAEAIAAYNRCQQALDSLLNIAPSFQTEEIYKKLLIP